MADIDIRLVVKSVGQETFNQIGQSVGLMKRAVSNLSVSSVRFGDEFSNSMSKASEEARALSNTALSAFDQIGKQAAISAQKIREVAKEQITKGVPSEHIIQYGRAAEGMERLAGITKKLSERVSDPAFSGETLMRKWQAATKDVELEVQKLISDYERMAKGTTGSLDIDLTKIYEEAIKLGKELAKTSIGVTDSLQLATDAAKEAGSAQAESSTETANAAANAAEKLAEVGKQGKASANSVSSSMKETSAFIDNLAVSITQTVQTLRELARLRKEYIASADMEADVALEGKIAGRQGSYSIGQSDIQGYIISLLNSAEVAASAGEDILGETISSIIDKTKLLERAKQNVVAITDEEKAAYAALSEEVIKYYESTSKLEKAVSPLTERQKESIATITELISKARELSNIVSQVSMKEGAKPEGKTGQDALVAFRDSLDAVFREISIQVSTGKMDLASISEAAGKYLSFIPDEAVEDTREKINLITSLVRDASIAFDTIFKSTTKGLPGYQSLEKINAGLAGIVYSAPERVSSMFYREGDISSAIESILQQLESGTSEVKAVASSLYDNVGDYLAGIPDKLQKSLKGVSLGDLSPEARSSVEQLFLEIVHAAASGGDNYKQVVSDKLGEVKAIVDAHLKEIKATEKEASKVGETIAKSPTPSGPKKPRSGRAERGDEITESQRQALGVAQKLGEGIAEAQQNALKKQMAAWSKEMKQLIADMRAGKIPVKAAGRTVGGSGPVEASGITSSEKLRNARRNQKLEEDRAAQAARDHARAVAKSSLELNKSMIQWVEMGKAGGRYRSLLTGRMVSKEVAARAGVTEGPAAGMVIPKPSIEQLRIGDELLKTIPKFEAWEGAVLTTTEEGARAFYRLQEVIMSLGATPINIDTSSLMSVRNEIAGTLTFIEEKIQKSLAADKAISPAVMSLMKMQRELHTVSERLDEYATKMHNAAVASKVFQEAADKLNIILTQGSEYVKRYVDSYMNATEKQRAASTTLSNVATNVEKLALATGITLPENITKSVESLRTLAADASSIVPQSLEEGRRSIVSVAAGMSEVLVGLRSKLATAAPEDIPGIRSVIEQFEKAQGSVLSYARSLKMAQGQVRNTDSALVQNANALNNTGRAATKLSKAAWRVPENLRKMQWAAREARLEFRPFQSAFQGIMLGFQIGKGNITGVLYSLMFLGAGIIKTVVKFAALTAAIVGFITITKLVIRTVNNMAKAMANAGMASDKLMNKLRPIVTTTRDMGRAYDYATAQAIKYGRAPEDVADAMDALSKAGLGNEEMFRAVAVAAVANGKTMTDAAGTFISAVGEEQANLEALRELHVNVSKDAVDSTNRQAVANHAAASILEQLGGAYKDVGQSAEQSFNRIKEGWKAIWSYMMAPIWQKVFVPILHYLANFVASLAEFARGIASSREATDHLNRTMAIFHATIKEYAPELRMIANLIKGAVTIAFQMLLGAVRLLVVGFRWLMQLVRSLMPLFSRLGQIAKAVRDVLQSLFPKGLGQQIRLWWVGIKEGVFNLWTILLKFISELRDDIKDFFERNPIGIFISAILEWTWEKITGAWDSLKKQATDWWERVGKDWVQENPFEALVLAVNLVVGLSYLLKGIKYASLLKLGKGIIGLVWTGLSTALKDAWFVYTVYAAIDLVIETVGDDEIRSQWEDFKIKVGNIIMEHPFGSLVAYLAAGKGLKAAFRWLGGKWAAESAVAFRAKLGPAISSALSGFAAKIGLTNMLWAAGVAIASILLVGLLGELGAGIPALSDTANSLLEYGLMPAFHTFAARFGQIMSTIAKGLIGLIDSTITGYIEGLQSLPDWLKKVLGIKEGSFEFFDRSGFEKAYAAIDEYVQGIEDALNRAKAGWADEKLAEVKLRLGLEGASHDEVMASLNYIRETPIPVSITPTIQGFEGYKEGQEIDLLGSGALDNLITPVQRENLLGYSQIWSDQIGSVIPSSLSALSTSFSETSVVYSESISSIEANTTTLGDTITTTVGIMKEEIKNFSTSATRDINSLVSGPLSKLVSKLDDVKSSLESIPKEIKVVVKADIDDQIKASSPSKLEIALRGVAAAADVVNRKEVSVGASAYTAGIASLASPSSSGGVVINVTVTGNNIIGTDQAKELADVTATEIMRRIAGKIPIANVR